jgi:hypothetical protein
MATRNTDTASLQFGPVSRLLARHDSLAYPYTCRFGNATLEIAMGVFCPTLSNASMLLLDALELPGRPLRFLDMFSGSGAFGINAALNGCQVVMVDRSEKATLCASRNARLNGVLERVTVLRGNLFDCLSENDRFDIVVANPPLLAGQPVSDLTGALFSPEFQAIVEFVLGVRKHLVEGSGMCYLVTSSVMSDCGMSLETLLRGTGLRADLRRTRDCGYEIYRVDVLTAENRACTRPEKTLPKDW